MRRIVVLGLLIARSAYSQPAPAPTQPQPPQPPPPPSEAAPPNEAAPSSEAAPPSDLSTATEPMPPAVVTPPSVTPPSIASAAPPKPDRYPSNLVERPLQIPAGATELDVSEEFRTYVSAIADMMGNVTIERNGFADDRTLVVGATHAFGRLAIGASLGRTSELRLAFDTRAIPSKVYATAFFGPFRSDDGYAYGQAAGAVHKVVLVPSRLAAVGGAYLVMNERRDVYEMTEAEGYSLAAGAGASAYVHLGWRFSLSSGIGGSVPIAHTQPFNPVAALSASLYSHLTLRKWDFYVGGNLFDVTRAHPSTFFTFGFRKRWGL